MKRIIVGALLGLAAAATAHAVPWCHRGHIYQVADITFTEQDLLNWANANIDWNNPPNVANLDYYIAFHASHEACQHYAGWTGPTWGVPGAGQVIAEVYAPSSYGTTLDGYTISQGLKFRCMKCSPLPIAEPLPPERF